MANNDFSKLSLGERDLYLKKLEENIKTKKALLLQETTNIENVKKGNKLLDGVHQKYKVYYDGIVKEKQQQQDAMMLLNQYLEELIKKENISEKQVKHARKDQQELILEMEKITLDLKEIVK
jgi:glutamine amidotransferase-like uncharacterized protein